MDFSQLPGKIIADRNSKKLGYVVDIRSIDYSSINSEKPKATMIVRIERALKEAIIAEVEVERILKIDGYYAWLDTTKKEFLESIKNSRRMIQQGKENQKADLFIQIDFPSHQVSKENNDNNNDLNITTELKESYAFKDYTSGRNHKFKTPWISIIIIGILTAIFSVLLYVFGLVAYGNPFAMNLIIGLLGLPAGFIIAFKNKTLDIMVSWRYSSFTGLIYTAVYFIIGIILTNISSLGLGNLFGGIFSLLLSCLVIGLYSILVTFAIGALLGTMIHGYLVDKK